LLYNYGSSIIMVFLALYGVWALCKDVWHGYLIARCQSPVRRSMLVILRNVEQQVEYMVRYLARQMEEENYWCDLVMVDYGSDDITSLVLDRLSVEFPILKVVHMEMEARPVIEGLSFCQGEVIHILDFVNRLSVEDFDGAAQLCIGK